MDLQTLMQTKLDNVLLPSGVLSHHLRRVKVDKINDPETGKPVKVNNDEYVVYRLQAPRGRAYGDGVAQLTQHYIDVNYYYSYDKTDSRFVAADARIKAIKAALLDDKHFNLTIRENDIVDVSNNYRGINMQFSYISTV